MIAVASKGHHRLQARNNTPKKSVMPIHSLEPGSQSARKIVTKRGVRCA